MKVVVTGANGFVGSAVVSHLEAKGHDVRAVVRRSEGLIPSSPAFIKDIGPDTDWSEVVAGVSHVVHTAARVHILNETENDPLSAFRKVNTAGTINLAQQAAMAGVQRFVFISTIAVNGSKTKDRPFTEQDTPNPHNAYAQSKWEAEQALEAIATATGMDVVIIRPPLVYGADAPGRFHQLMNIVKYNLPLPFGKIDNFKSLIAIDNMVDVICLCLKHPDAKNQVYFVGDDETYSTTKILREVAKARNKTLLLVPVPAGWMMLLAKLLGMHAAADSLFGSLTIDTKKVKSQLGWTPITSMSKQMQKRADRL